MAQGSADVYRAALKRELAGYEAAGNAERAKQVKAQLAKLGGEAPREEMTDEDRETTEGAGTRRRRSG